MDNSSSMLVSSLSILDYISEGRVHELMYMYIAPARYMYIHVCVMYMYVRTEWLKALLW